MSTPSGFWTSGSQYVQLIARRIREAGAFSVLLAPDASPEEIMRWKPRGIVLSGGPASIDEQDAPTCHRDLFDLDVPMLGICYGMQLGSHMLGARVARAEASEYGRAKLHIASDEGLFAGIPSDTTVWMSHGDQVENVTHHFDVLASTDTMPRGGRAAPNPSVLRSPIPP